MSYPILFPDTETEFKTNGIGILSSTTKWTVTEERNGIFELEMKYPLTGIHYEDLALDYIIVAKPNPVDTAQQFRIYHITEPLAGIVTVYARHLSYDLLDITVSPFSGAGIIQAFANMKAAAVNPCPFNFWTDKTTEGNMTVNVPSSIRSLLGGQIGSFLDLYGGEYKFDGYTVKLYGERGVDRGVTIRYGKNLLDLQQEKNCANVYTGVYPYWADMDGKLVTLPEKIIHAAGTYKREKIRPLDLSGEWQEAPTVTQLRNKATTYVTANNIGVPSISLTVSYAQLEQTEEYKNIALLERLDLCDTVTIEFPDLGVSAKAKAVKTVYNGLLNRYDSVSFGDARTNLADTMVNQQKETKDAIAQGNKSAVRTAMDKMNEMVQNASGMYSTDEIQPDGSTIHYLHDKKTLDESTNIIKVTNEAIGFSTDGGKTYPFGLEINGDVVANILSAIGVQASWINVEELLAQNITATGIIQFINQWYSIQAGGTDNEKTVTLRAFGELAVEGAPVMITSRGNDIVLSAIRNIVLEATRGIQIIEDKETYTLSDFVVDQDRVGDWEYRKWKSGKYELWGVIAVQIPSSLTEWNNSFIANDLTVQLPFQMTGASVAGTATQYQHITNAYVTDDTLTYSLMSTLNQAGQTCTAKFYISN